MQKATFAVVSSWTFPDFPSQPLPHFSDNSHLKHYYKMDFVNSSYFAWWVTMDGQH